MAKYSDIKGFTVQTLSTDTIASQIAGGAWASDANMNTARIASTGTGSSSEGYIIAGGYYLPPSADRSVTESYNGTAWSEVADCPQDLTYGNGLGSYTSSLLCSYSQPGPAPGGYGPTTATHQWNGSSWSTKNSMNTFRQNAGTGGTTTAGIVFGGTAPGANANTETWDGTNWTEVGDLNTAKSDIGGGVGTQTAALSASGNPVTTEQWDGSSWTEVTEINTPRQNSGKVGLYTSALCVSGQNPSTYLANVEAWDGTSWTEVSDVSAARGYVGGATISGGNASGIIAGGSGSSLSSATEIWSAPATFNKTTEGQLYFNSTTNSFKETIQDIPAGTWASTSSLNTAREALQKRGAGSNTQGFVVGGLEPALSAKTESWDGSSWTEIGDTPAGCRSGMATGAYTSAIQGGGDPGAGKTGECDTWDGSSWTEIAELNSAREIGGAGGESSTSALFFGGSGPNPSRAITESWDGSSWTEVADLNTGRNIGTGLGTQTAALAVAGYVPPSSSGHTGVVEQWNGSSWTEIADINSERFDMGSSGLGVTSALVFGGSTPPAGKFNNTEFWNGSSWTELNNLAEGRSSGGSIGTSATGVLYAGGTDGSLVASSEEWTVSLANKTITAS